MFLVWVFCVLYLCVGVGVLIMPQDCNWWRLLFGFGLCFCSCWDVGTVLFLHMLCISSCWVGWRVGVSVHAKNIFKIMAPGGGFEPPRPREATSWVVPVLSEASPGLLPAWLGDPGSAFLHSHDWRFYYSFATQLKPLQNSPNPKSNSVFG